MQVLDAETQEPIANVKVYVFPYSDSSAEDHQVFSWTGVTDTQGRVRLPREQSIYASRVEVVTEDVRYWSRTFRNLRIGPQSCFELVPISASSPWDVVQRTVGRGQARDGAGVRVAVIDGGVAVSPALPRLLGDGESRIDCHGSYVADVIASNGALKGVAPGVEIRSYNPFEQDSVYDERLAQVVTSAANDDCLLINLSWKLYGDVPLTQEAIRYAYQNGCLVFAASGNDKKDPFKQGVSRVARNLAGAPCLVVSAFGDRAALPNDSPTRTKAVAPPFGHDPNHFLASFSDTGPEVNFTAPGVGVIAHGPRGYLAQDGTSLACPILVGLAARLLSQPAHRAILNMPPDPNRANAILRRLGERARDLGFELHAQGQGLPHV
jgi:subtilisin family serine protease